MVLDALSGLVEFLNKIKDAIIAFLEGVAGLARILASIATSTLQYIWNGIRTLLELILESVKYIWNTMTWLFTSIMDMMLTGITNIVKLVQCGLTSVYRRFKERIPVLLMYNSMIAYTRRIIERGEPLDFLKIPLMGLGAGLSGVMIAGLIPDIPADVCVNVTPLTVEEYRTVTPPPPRLPIRETIAMFDLVTLTDRFTVRVRPPIIQVDTVIVNDSFNVTVTPGGEAGGGGEVTLYDTVTLTDTFTVPGLIGVETNVELADSVTLTDTFTYTSG